MPQIEIEGGGGDPPRETSQDDFPQKWACENDQKRVKVEVRVQDQRGTVWIEIPTTTVEMYVEKGEAARIQRTAKVEFPTEWGRDGFTVRHNSPRKLIESFSPDTDDGSRFLFARVSFKPPDYDEYITQHIGWVGGVGQSGDDGVSKMWVYDVSEMLSGVPTGHTFNNPTTKRAVEVLARKTNDHTPIPISDTKIVTPQAEEEFAVVADRLDAGDLDLDESLQDLNMTGAYFTSGGDATVEEVARPIGENFESVEIGTGDIPAFGWNTKSFNSNHDTLNDMFRWFEDKTGSRVHFEPAPGGDSLILIADIRRSRRIFTGKEVMKRAVNGNLDGALYEAYEAHDTVTVLKNTALYEMKPVNTLHLRGSFNIGLWDAAEGVVSGTTLGDLGLASPPPAEKYPVVKVQSKPLLLAANGFELAPEVIESDASSLDEAEQEAIEELSKQLDETTEGSIVLKGHPLILPEDGVDAFEQCGDQVQFEPQPQRYEVESVKHVATADDIYKTEVSVSVWANEASIDVVESKMVEA